MPKPSTHLNWTDGDAAKVNEPVAGKKLLGWVASERPAFQFMNWLFYIQDQWNKYFESITDAVLANSTYYDAVVGVGGTHSTIPDLMADADIASKKNVLVISPIAVDTTIVLDQDGMNFDFKPQALVSKAGATVAFQITGSRIRFRGARIVNFNGGSDEAIKIEPGANNNLLADCFFSNNTASVTDNGENNNFDNLIEEV